MGFGTLPSSLLTGDSIWVDATLGSDSSGVRDNASKPFLTLTAAKTAASSGDTIVVRPGTYTGAALAKDGVNWHFESGAAVSGTADLFTDAAGAMSFTVTGSGVLSTTGNASVINLSNSGSVVAFTAKTLAQTGGATVNATAIFHVAGTLTVEAETISGNNSGIYWEGGMQFVRCMVISGTQIGYYALNVVAGMHAHVTADIIQATGEGTCECIESTGDATAGLWVDCKRMLAPSGTCAFNTTGMKLYIRTEKIEVATTTDDFAVMWIHSGLVYLTAQKLEVLSANETDVGILNLAGGQSFVDIGQVIMSGGNPLPGILCASGVHDIRFTRLTTSGDGIDISGGTLRFSGAIDTSASATANPVNKSGGTLVLKGGATLIAEGSRDSITAGTAQNVVALGAWANKAVNGNVTITTTAGLNINSNVT